MSRHLSQVQFKNSRKFKLELQLNLPNLIRPTDSHGHNPADRNYKPDSKRSDKYSDGGGSTPKGTTGPLADEQTSRQYTKRSAKRYNVFGSATKHSFNKPGMEDLKQQYMMAKAARQPTTHRDGDYRGRPRAMSSVPDLCIDKGTVTLTDIVTASFRIRDGTIRTPCDVSIACD